MGYEDLSPWNKLLAGSAARNRRAAQERGDAEAAAKFQQEYEDRISGNLVSPEPGSPEWEADYQKFLEENNLAPKKNPVPQVNFTAKIEKPENNDLGYFDRQQQASENSNAEAAGLDTQFITQPQTTEQDQGKQDFIGPVMVSDEDEEEKKKKQVNMSANSLAIQPDSGYSLGGQGLVENRDVWNSDSVKQFRQNWQDQKKEERQNSEQRAATAQREFWDQQAKENGQSGYDDSFDFWGALAATLGSIPVIPEGVTDPETVQMIMDGAKENQAKVADLANNHRVDDGTSHRLNYSSTWVTGEQYGKYVDSGAVTTDRPRDEIVPGRMYNKTEENMLHGADFINQEETGEITDLVNPLRWGQALENVGHLGTMITDGFADARDNSSSATIDLNGKTYKYNDLYDQMSRWIDGYQLPSDSPLDDHSNDTLLMPAKYTVNYSDGTSEEFEGGLFDTYENDDGTIEVRFSDGKWATFDNADDYYDSFYGLDQNSDLTDVVQVDDSNVISNFVEAGDKENPFVWKQGQLPTFINYRYSAKMTDPKTGDEFSLDDVQKVLQASGQQGAKDLNLQNTGLFNIGKPKNFLEENPFEGDWAPDLLPQFIDIATGSAPLLAGGKLPAVPWLWGLAEAEERSHNVNPGTNMRDGSYRQTIGTIDDEARKALLKAGMTEDEIDAYGDDQLAPSMAAYATMPLTEGLIGFGSWPVMRNFYGKIGQYLPEFITKNPLAPGGKFLGNIAAEAGEEVPGNAYEGVQQHGFSGWYAEPYLDENGNKIVDSAGNPIMNPHTDWSDRSENFNEDIPGALGGGALLAGGLSLGRIPGTVVETAQNVKDFNNRDRYWTRGKVPTNNPFKRGE